MRREREERENKEKERKRKKEERRERKKERKKEGEREERERKKEKEKEKDLIINISHTPFTMESRHSPLSYINRDTLSVHVRSKYIIIPYTSSLRNLRWDLYSPVTIWKDIETKGG